VDEYTDLILAANKEHDVGFLKSLLDYSSDYMEDQLEHLMEELNICPNCCSELFTVCDNELHGYDAFDPLIENFRHKECSVCHFGK
jgi:hypothetical protein